MTDKNTPAIAFVGLGSMGLGMARNLLRHGHKVVGVDPSEAARTAFAAAGGTIATAPADAAKTADVVIVAVVNDKQVETVLFGDSGAVSTLRKGGVVMQCATVPAAFSRALAERLYPSRAQVQFAGIPDRNEPEIGEVNHLYLRGELDRLGYDGYVGLEYKPKTTTVDGLGWAKRYGIHP